MNSILTLILIAFVTVKAEARDYYVATGGSDSGTGTADQPFKTMLKAASVLGPGDTLLMMEGTYSENTNQIDMPSGSASQPITWRAVQGHRVVIEGCPMKFHGGTSYVVIDRLIFDQREPRPGCLYLGRAGNPIGPDHITLKNFEIIGGPGDGLTIDSTNITLSNGKIHSNSGSACFASYGDASYCHGIYIDAGENIVIENLEIYNTPGHAVKVSQKGPTKNVVVRNNVFHDWAQVNYTSAILFGSGSSDSTAYNNVIYNCSGLDTTGNGIDAIQFWSGNGNSVFNNTIDLRGGNCQAGIRIVYGTQSRIENNIVIGGQSNMYDHGGLGAIYEFRNNFCEQPGFGCDFFGDPLFVNASGHDYHLQPGSPVIDLGVRQSGLSKDLDGRSRPTGGGYDIGAFEYGDASAPTPTDNEAPTATILSPGSGSTIPRFTL